MILARISAPVARHSPFVPVRIEVSLCRVVNDGIAQLLDAGKAAMPDDIFTGPVGELGVSGVVAISASVVVTHQLMTIPPPVVRYSSYRPTQKCPSMVFVVRVHVSACAEGGPVCRFEAGPF
jgi:hypothetical protein